jgi:hypothetical protein
MKRYTRHVRRAIFFAATVAITLLWPLGSDASPRTSSVKPAARHDVSGHFTMRVRYKNGPWVTRIALKLKRYQLMEFKLCGVWDWPTTRRFTCLGAGTPLPPRTTARMEQSPVGKALRREDSPGWGMVGLSTDPVIKTPLSNTTTGNKYGAFYYRVTLRDVSGAVLVTSNKVAVVWLR